MYGIPKDGAHETWLFVHTNVSLTICHGVSLHPHEEVCIAYPLYSVIQVGNCSQSDLSIESIYHSLDKSARYVDQEQEDVTVALPTLIQ